MTYPGTVWLVLCQCKGQKPRVSSDPELAAMDLELEMRASGRKRDGCCRFCKQPIEIVEYVRKS